MTNAYSYEDAIPSHPPLDDVEHQICRGCAHREELRIIVENSRVPTNGKHLIVCPVACARIQEALEALSRIERPLKSFTAKK